MSTKHTPGPWSVSVRNTVQAICCKPTRKGEWSDICYIERDGHPEHGSITSRMRTTAELAANARLIAAAPQLLAACQAINEDVQLFSAFSHFYGEECAARLCNLLRDSIRDATKED